MIHASQVHSTRTHRWASRLERIVRRADDLGMVVIVQYFYGYQFDRVFGNNNPTASHAAIHAATTFLVGLNVNNVIIDVYNEHCSPSEAALVELVHNISKAAGNRLITSTSCGMTLHCVSIKMSSISFHVKFVLELIETLVQF